MGDASIPEAIMDIKTRAVQSITAIEGTASQSAMDMNQRLLIPTHFVKILVGREQLPYDVRYDKLFAWARYLTDKQPTPTSSISLQYAEPRDFEIILEWINMEELPPLTISYPTDEENEKRLPMLAWNPYTVYLLSEKLRIPYLCDIIMDALRRLTSTHGLGLSALEISTYYRASISKWSGLGKYLMELFALIHVGEAATREHVWHLTSTLDMPDRNWFAIESKLRKMENDDLVNAVMRHMKDREAWGLKLADPRFGVDCRFHRHSSRDCPARRGDGGIMRPYEYHAFGGMGSYGDRGD